MISICAFDGVHEDRFPWSISRAAKYVSDKYSAIHPLISVSPSTVKRWYNHWLSFEMLTSRTPKKLRIRANYALKE